MTPLLVRHGVSSLVLFAAVSHQQQPRQQPQLNQQEAYSVRFHVQLEANGTIEDGAFVLTVHPAWAPLGVCVCVPRHSFPHVNY